MGWFYQSYGIMQKKLINLLILFNLSILFSFAQDNSSDDIFPIEAIDNLTVSERLDSMTEERPEEEYQEVVYTPRTSTLHIPLDINISFLEKKGLEGKL